MPPASDRPLISSNRARLLDVRGRCLRAGREPDVPAVCVLFIAAEDDGRDEEEPEDAVVEDGAGVGVVSARAACAGAFDVTTGLSASLCQLPFSSKYPSAADFISTGISPAVFVVDFGSSLVASTRVWLALAMRTACDFG